MSKPGMSAKVRLEIVTFFGLKISANSSTRGSCTSAGPSPSCCRTWWRGSGLRGG